MLFFIISFMTIQGISTYLLSLVITKSLVYSMTKVSPLMILDNYTPDRLFDNKYISILSRFLLFTSGFTGILLCLIVHEIIFIFKKQCDTHCSDTIVLHEIPVTDVSPLDFTTVTNIDYFNIDLIIDNSLIQSRLNYISIRKLLYLNGIICKRIAFFTVDKDSKENKCKQLNLIGDASSQFYNITSKSIDDAIFTFNNSYWSEDIEQTICLCLNTDDNLTFEHLCVKVPETDTDLLNNNTYQKLLVDRIINCIDIINKRI